VCALAGHHFSLGKDTKNFVLLISTITQSGLTGINQAVAAIVVLFATIYGSKSAIGIMAAGSHFAADRGAWDEARGQLMGACIGLALAVLVGTSAFNLGGVGALY
jgi:hypothetical protein